MSRMCCSNWFSPDVKNVLVGFLLMSRMCCSSGFFPDVNGVPFSGFILMSRIF